MKNDAPEREKERKREDEGRRQTDRLTETDRDSDLVFYKD